MRPAWRCVPSFCPWKCGGSNDPRTNPDHCAQHAAAENAVAEAHAALHEQEDPAYAAVASAAAISSAGGARKSVNPPPPPSLMNAPEPPEPPEPFDALLPSLLPSR